MISLLIAFFTLAIFISFLCSMWEAVLLSVTPSYAQIKLKEGTRVGTLLKSYKEDIDRPLAAILTLNTIAHTVGAVGVGNQANRIWADWNPLVTNLAVPAVMTLAILVLSELIPKTIGANYWKELAHFTTYSISWLIKLLYPLIWFSQRMMQVLKKEEGKSVFSRSDFLAMAEVGAEQGVFEQRESDIIANLIRFDSIRAKDVMTPRVMVKSVPRDQSLDGFYEGNREFRFSRIPLREGNSVDRITGYVLKDELLAELLQGDRTAPLSAFERPLIAVPEDFPIPELFNLLVRRREHIAMAVDAFGGLAGIVTMEDVIETLLGLEIVDETDAVEDLQSQARKNWERRAQQLNLLSDPDPQEEPPKPEEGG